jgi:hypothetical protein
MDGSMIDEMNSNTDDEDLVSTACHEIGEVCSLVRLRRFGSPHPRESGRYDLVCTNISKYDLGNMRCLAQGPILVGATALAAAVVAFAVGDYVELCGLSSAEFNGLRGTLDERRSKLPISVRRSTHISMFSFGLSCSSFLFLLHEYFPNL